MHYSVPFLSSQIHETLVAIDTQIVRIKTEAEAQGSTLELWRDEKGTTFITPLLQARASCLNAASLLLAAELSNKKKK